MKQGGSTLTAERKRKQRKMEKKALKKGREAGNIDKDGIAIEPKPRTETVYRAFFSVTPKFEQLLSDEIHRLNSDDHHNRNSSKNGGVHDDHEVPHIDAAATSSSTSSPPATPSPPTGRSRIKIRHLNGGVECLMTRSQLWHTIACSRLAESVRVRVGSSFKAWNFDLLEKRLPLVPWRAYFPLSSEEGHRVQATCHKSALYHSGAVEERVHNHLQQLSARAITEQRDPASVADAEAMAAKALGSSSSSSSSSSSASSSATPLIPPSPLKVHVRIAKDDVQISLDAAANLFKRGYRTYVADAPLRESIASACLMYAAEADGEPDVLWDPFVGSGTIPLEAAVASHHQFVNLLSRDANLPFAFEAWRTHDKSAYRAFVDASQPFRSIGSPLHSHLTYTYPSSSTSSSLLSSSPPSSSSPPLSPSSSPPSSSSSSSSPAPHSSRIFIGSDISSECIELSQMNARRAGSLVSDSCSFLTGDFEKVAARQPFLSAPPSRAQGETTGMPHRRVGVVTNIPYGKRIGSQDNLRHLFLRFNQFLRGRPDLASVHVLDGTRQGEFLSAAGRASMRWDVVTTFLNRGHQVQLLRLLR